MTYYDISKKLTPWRRQSGSSLRNRLHFYLITLIFILLFCVFVLLIALNIFSTPKSTIANQLQAGLDRYSVQLSTYFSNTAARGIRLSQLASGVIEKTLWKHHISFEQLTDNPRLIELMEESTYELLRNSLMVADCSGAFFIFDTTVNTKLPDSSMSRSGIYLRRNNLSTSKPVNPDFAWLRGVHNVGARHGHIFHNKWELEFSLKQLPFYQTLKACASQDLTRCYLYTTKLNLSGTWESMMWLCVPLIDTNGTFYGICGLEISSLYFKLTYLADRSDAQRATGLIACQHKNQLLPSTGLESGSASGYFADLGLEPLTIEVLSSSLNLYSSNAGKFVGMEKQVQLSPLDAGNEWVMAYFIPEEDYAQAMQLHYLKIALFCLVFLLFALVISYFVGRRYINPVLTGIDAIKNGSAETTSIKEIDDLINFLSLQDNNADNEADMSGFHNFINNIEKLSPAERAVFNLYLEGYSAQDIASKLFISINTVKSHNRRIYMKLEISSRKELMIYAKMLKKLPDDQQNSDSRPEK